MRICPEPQSGSALPVHARPPTNGVRARGRKGVMKMRFVVIMIAILVLAGLPEIVELQRLGGIYVKP